MKLFKKMLPYYILTLVLAVACSAAFSQSAAAISAGLAAAKDGLPTILIDPGHGGEDGGAVSPNGVQESGLNLEIGLRTRDLLRFCGLPAAMTRETDCSIHSPEAATLSEKKVSDLKNRVRIVNELDGSILLSIHQNMFSDSKYRGAQVFYAGTPGSKELAEVLQAVICTDLDPANHRQAKPSESIYLLNKIEHTGVLVECGFLSNPEEERMLQTERYQIKLAAAICAAAVRYLTDPEGTMERGDPHENQNDLLLYQLRQRNPPVDGQMPGLRCLELSAGAQGNAGQRDAEHRVCLPGRKKTKAPV